MMKRIFILIILAAVASNVFAQRRLKYKDIFDRIGKEPVEHSVLKLSEFQKNNPEFPNTYLQIGAIQWNWLKEEDPFLNYQYVKRLIYNTKLYLGLAKSKINADEKEVKKNKTYYGNFNITSSIDDLDQQAVLNYIQKISDKVLEYEKNVTAIINNYNSTVSKYNTCLDTYKSIVARQSNYKNLLLTSTGEYKQQMKDLSQNYDSVIYFFNEFKTALGNYPIKNYNQNLKITKIATYRLEGLTSSDFLKPEITIWDYQSWVKDAFKLMDGDINTLKDGGEQEIKNLRARVVALKESQAETDSIQEVTIKNKLVNLTEKYDYESLLSASIKYETDKANFQIASMRSANNINNPASFNESLESKANYYYDLYSQAETTKKALKVLKERISDKNISKQEQLVNSLYGGKTKFSSYEKEELAKINTIEDTNINNFQKYAVNQLYPVGEEVTVQGKKINLEAKFTPFSEAATGSCNTVYTIKDDNGNRYAAGYVKTSATNSNGFVAKIDANGTPVWFTNLNAAPTGENNVVRIIPSNFSGILVLVGNSSASGCKTSVIKLDNNGKQTSKTDLTSTLYPTVVCYDEINEVASVVLKGNNGNFSTEKDDDCIVETVTLGQKNSSVLSQTFNLKGKVTDIIKMGENNIIICSFKEIKAGNDSQKAGSNIAAVKISPSEISCKTYKTDKDLFAVKAFKINTESINILGNFNSMDSPVTQENAPCYIIINDKGEFIH
ncbi:MAG: hypothetical protein II937_01695 [Bacteroidales bacterium]|nr:hypothetical protein [Bacteroidales bacterium]